MTKRIQKFGMVAVAVAASTFLVSAPAQADTTSGNAHYIQSVQDGELFQTVNFATAQPHRHSGFGRRGSLSSLRHHKQFKKHSRLHGRSGFESGFSHHQRGRRGAARLKKHHLGIGHINQYGRALNHETRLKQEALHQCSVQLNQDATSYGYRGSRLTDSTIQQVAHGKFLINANARLFDGYKINHETYSCTVYDGQVIDASKPSVRGHG